MTDAPTLTGREIGLAENATRAVLDSLLAANATTFEHWVVLNLAAGDGGSVAMSREERRKLCQVLLGDNGVRAVEFQSPAA